MVAGLLEQLRQRQETLIRDVVEKRLQSDGR
jgi:hypothetical protein